MTGKFPHLPDSDFPGIDNIDVFARPDFDYKRWDATPKTRIKLLNVNFCGDYDNVVKFADDEARDGWFETAPGETVEIDTAFSHVPEAAIRLPLPMDEARAYNYLVVEIPEFTGDAPVDFETPKGYRKFFYFIDSLRMLAPSTTEAMISEDVWTSYINHIEINYMLLERGHWPVANSDPDSYLEDPIRNNSLLLAPDVDFGAGSMKVGSSEFHPVAMGRRSVVLALCCEPSELVNLGSVSDAVTSAPVFGNIPNDAYGADAAIDDYGWAGNGREYSSVRTPVTRTGSFDMVTANSTWYIECDAGDVFATDKLSDALEIHPSLANVIKRAYVIPTDLLTFSGSMSALGISWRIVSGTAARDVKINLSRESFDVPDEAGRFAKIFTWPYAWIEVSSPMGAPVIVRVENLAADASVTTDLLLSDPIAQAIQFVDGVGSNRVNLINVRRFDGAMADSFLPDSRLADTLMTMEIESFAINWSASDADYLAHYNTSIRIPRNSQMQIYRVSTRAANATQAQINATNATNRTNAQNTANNINANAQADVQLLTTVTSNQLENNTALNFLNNSVLNASNMNSNSVVQQTVEAENQAATQAAYTNGLGNFVNSIASGNIVGAITGAITTADTLSINTNLASEKAGIVTASNGNMTQLTVTQNTAGTNANNTLTSDNAAANNTRTYTVAGNNANLTVTNANNSANTSDSNASIARNVSVQNSQTTPLLTAQYDQERRFLDSQNGRPGNIGTQSGPSELDAIGWNGTQIRFVTQGDGALMQTAAQFARYGYRLNQAMAFDGFSHMENFDFWKVSDVWLVGDDGVLEGAQRVIRDVLVKGTTVWRDPEKIGNVSVFDN